MSACWSYPFDCSITSGAILHSYDQPCSKTKHTRSQCAPARRADKGLMRAGAEAAKAGRGDAVICQLNVAVVVDKDVTSLERAPWVSKTQRGRHQSCTQTLMSRWMLPLRWK